MDAEAEYRATVSVPNRKWAYRKSARDGHRTADAVPKSERSPEHRVGHSTVADRFSGHGVGRRKTIKIKSACEPVSLCLVRAAVSLMLLFALNALAWVYPEHRDITLLALQGLDPAQRALIEKLWSQARAGHEARLCAQMAYTAQGSQVTCIDYAAWPAISGDHSCSARDMLSIVLGSRWILRVARVGARLKNQLATATRRHQRTNAVRESDLALVRADRDYLARATANKAHFPLARSSVTMDLPGYVQIALRPESELNALAVYMWYHLRALAKARSIPSAGLSPKGTHRLRAQRSRTRRSLCTSSKTALRPVTSPERGAMRPCGRARTTITTNMDWMRLAGTTGASSPSATQTCSRETQIAWPPPSARA